MSNGGVGGVYGDMLGGQIGTQISTYQSYPPSGNVLTAEEAYSQALGAQAAAGPLSSGVLDNASGGTPASDPYASSGGYLTGGSNVGGVPVIQSPGSSPSLIINPSGATSGSTGASGQSVNVGLQSGLAKIIGGAGSYFSNWLERGFLIVIGLVIAAIGVMHLMDPGFHKTRGILARLP
jgi:hypothetical protein